MNYLAHAYLSFDHPRVLVGNMISDFVKGAKRFQYERQIAAGIQLHRHIDGFTDAHPATIRAKEFFRPHYRLYSGAFVDIAYDHFLANDKTRFPGDTLHSFSISVYATLEQHLAELPPRFLQLLPYMQKENWLYHYRERQGIQRSYRGLAHRAAYMHDSTAAFRVFEEAYEELGACYELFIEDVKTFAKQEFRQLLG